MERPWKQILEEIQRLELLGSDDFKHLKQMSASPANAERLLTRFVRDKKLTKYQASNLLEGKGSRLLIGNYVILKPLGHGGMGHVFQARHQQMDRTVAIKTISPHLVMQGIANKRFANEIRFLAQLSHPNIVLAFDAGVHEGLPYLVTEFVEGIDLKKLIEKSGPLDVRTAVRYMFQAASALAYAHANNIVHRDVKPANLIVKSDGQVKLLDLGVARATQPASDDVSDAGLTAENSIIGSLEYTPPEIFMNPKRVGPQSDIYSLGCTMFFLIRGKVPYPGKCPMDFFHSHPKAPIPKICDPDQFYSSKLASLFQRMVAKTPEKRIQQMAEVAAECKRILESIDLHDGDNSARDESVDVDGFDSSSNSELSLTADDAPWYRRNGWALLACITIAAAIGGGTVWYLTSIAREKSQTRSFMTDDSLVPKVGDQPTGTTDPRSKVQRVRGSRVFRVDD